MRASYLLQTCAHGLYLLYIVLQYCWIKPAAAEPRRASGPKRRAPPSAVRGKATFRICMCTFLLVSHNATLSIGTCLCFQTVKVIVSLVRENVLQILVVVTTQSARKEKICDLFPFINIGKGFCFSTSSGS